MAENGSSETSELEAKIIRQVEYYFGDINLVKDKFLQGQVKEDDGWVSLETMIKFKRLAALSEDFDVITKALKKSTSGLMEVDENKIRRCPDKKLPENIDAMRDAVKNRVVYCKGFPLDATLDEIMEFMEKFGRSEHIFMRKDKQKEFKGSIFCTYETEESAKRYLAEESLKWKDGEEELIRHSREAYFQKKNVEKRAAKELQAKEKEQKNKQKEVDEEEAFKNRIQYNAVLVVTNLPSDVKREALKEKFEAFSQVQWIDFDTGSSEAKIRFSEAGAATKAWEAAVAEVGEGAKVKVGDSEVEGRVMTGEEEMEHWRDVVQQQKASKFGRRRGGGKPGHRGGGGGGGRKRSAQDAGGDGPSEAKQPKTEGDGPSEAKQPKTEGD